MKVLFLTYRCPFPPTTGERFRAWQHIKMLAQQHEVTLVTFAPTTEETAPPAELAAACKAVHFVHFNRFEATVRALGSLFLGGPLQVAYYHSPQMRRFLLDLHSREQFDLCYLALARTAPYGLALQDIPRLFDFVDAYAWYFKRLQESGTPWKRWIYGLESRRLADYEPKLAEAFEKTIITSPVDAVNIGSLYVPTPIPMAIGIDAEIPAGEDTLLPSGMANLAFIGDMSHVSAVIAVTFFMEEIWPIIRGAQPDAVFWIIGRDPSPQIRKFAGPGVQITGAVRSFRPYFQRLQAVVVPLKVGSGIKTKVLQAMADGVPVVGTPIANEGIFAVHGQDILVAEEPEDFAKQVLFLLKNPDRAQAIGEAGKRFVYQGFTMEAVGARLEAAVQEAVLRRNHSRAPIMK